MGWSYFDIIWASLTQLSPVPPDIILSSHETDERKMSPDRAVRRARRQLVRSLEPRARRRHGVLASPTWCRHGDGVTWHVIKSIRSLLWLQTKLLATGFCHPAGSQPGLAPALALPRRQTLFVKQNNKPKEQQRRTDRRQSAAHHLCSCCFGI